MKIVVRLAHVSLVVASQAHSALAQDAAAGRAVFAQCAPCHSLDGSNGLGPTLLGIGGRKPGSFPGFRYSRAMKSVRSNWDAASLDAYIADPQSAIPGNVMPFSGLTDKQQREDLVAFLLMLN